MEPAMTLGGRTETAVNQPTANLRGEAEQRRPAPDGSRQDPPLHRAPADLDKLGGAPGIAGTTGLAVLVAILLREPTATNARQDAALLGSVRTEPD
jgi:hypothetical protein